MNDFVWLLPRDKAESLCDAGVSESYILPRAYVLGMAYELQGNYLWVIIRGEYDRVFFVLHIRSVTEILDGYYQHDFMVHPDLLRSFKISSHYSDLELYSTKIFSSYPEGISSISPEETAILTDLLRSNITVKLAPLGNKVISRIATDRVSKNHELLVLKILKKAVTSINLTDIWCNGGKKKYRAKPFSSLVRSYLQYYPEYDLNSFDDLIVSLDPFDVLVNRQKEKDIFVSDKKYIAKPSSVDIYFTPIDPAKIFARKYDAKDLGESDPLERIEKTEFSEFRHQDILRDAAKYLLSNGIQPMQSQSIDLAYKIGNIFYIVEIKSATDDNVVDQVSKGIFQLAHYKLAINDDYECVCKILLVEDFENPLMNKYLERISNSLGVEICFYLHSSDLLCRFTNLPVS